MDRKCEVYKDVVGGQRVFDYKGTFLGFGIKGIAEPDGIAHNTSALVESEKGFLDSVDLCNIKLLSE